jgi:hypothetical protein
MGLGRRVPVPDADAGALILAMLLGGLVPMLLVTGAGGMAAALAVCVIVLAGTRLGWLIGIGQPRLTEFSLWTFTYVFLGLAALVQFQTATFPTSAPWFDTAFHDNAEVAVLVGSAAAMLGIRLAAGRPATRALLRTPMVHERRVHLLATISLPVNLYYLVQIGPATVLQSREEMWAAQIARWPGTGPTALAVAVSTLPLLVVFIGLLGVNRQRADRGESPRYTLLVVVGSAVLYSVNPISSPRYFSGTVILSMVAALGAYATPWRMRISAMAFLGGLFLLFPLADAFRAKGRVDTEVAPIESLSTGDFDSTIQISNSLDVLADTGITWGRQLLGVPLFWVPRESWPEKPVSTGTYIADHMGYSFTNISSPLIAELLINGGWPLLIVGMFGFGWWVRRRDDHMVRFGRLGGRLSAIDWILPFYLIMVLRGSLLSAALQFSVLWAAARFVQGRSTGRDDMRGRRTGGGDRRPTTLAGSDLVRAGACPSGDRRVGSRWL